MNNLFLERAMLITGNFEGSDPWANITGNFDGEGLTCGQLGKTVKAGDQQTVVRNYRKQHGDSELNALMPQTGSAYVTAMKGSISTGMDIVTKWSNGSATVKQPYRSELAAFWKSAKMIVKQREHAAEHEGKLAEEWIGAWNGDGSFQEFAVFFDIAAQNGSLKDVDAAAVDGFIGNDPRQAVATALAWVEGVTSGTSGDKDARKNAVLWRSLLAGAAIGGVRLFILAYLRSRKATAKWQWDVMNRKGALAMGEGWVHGRKWSFLDQFNIAPVGDTPVMEEIPLVKPVVPPANPAPVDPTTLFRVAAHSGLRLRSSTSTANSKNIVANFPQGTLVRFVAVAADPKWWEVTVDADGLTRKGFMAAGYLTPASGTVTPVPAGGGASPVVHQPLTAAGIVEVHFPIPAGRIVKRSETNGRIWRINEAGAPTRTGATPATMKRQIADILDWLDVEHSARHLPGGGNTFCNIYAYDFACLTGCYIPRVWWTQKGIQQLSLGQTVAIKYEDTVDEWTANQLYQWFRDWGAQFGWSGASGLDDLQSHANAGGISIIVAKNSSGHGHITAVVPETENQAAARNSAGNVLRPLESQAGSSNHKYVTKGSQWWTPSRYTVGYWKHA